MSVIPFNQLKEGQYFEIENIPFRRGNDLNGYGQCTRLVDEMQVHPLPGQRVRVISIHEAKRLVDQCLGNHLLIHQECTCTTRWSYDFVAAMQRSPAAKRRKTARKRRKREHA